MTNSIVQIAHDVPRDAGVRYRRAIFAVAGLGGMLYGIDVGIIGGALPYLEATSRLDASQLSVIVAAVLLGSVISTLFAGLLADRFGRRPLMTISGAAFVLSIPVIALSHGYGALFSGRLLQGISGGLIGVVVPLYLAECLPAADRGKGAGAFQWLLTLGIVSAALIGVYYSYKIQLIRVNEETAALLTFEDRAWRGIFWASLPPGILFTLGTLFVSESPRWLFLKGDAEKAKQILIRSGESVDTEVPLPPRGERNASGSVQATSKGKLLSRRYVVPFTLACIVLFCNTATGISSIIAYNTSILVQSGLSDLAAHKSYVLFTIVNFVMTLCGMVLVDLKGRRFLFIVGTVGITVATVAVGYLFHVTERSNVECRNTIQTSVASNQTLTFPFDKEHVALISAAVGDSHPRSQQEQKSLAIIYSYGDYTATTKFYRSGDGTVNLIQIRREDCIPRNRIEAFFKNPFANFDASQRAPLIVDRAIFGTVPSVLHGNLVAAALYLFIAFFAVGPGVCVWLALSELMPTRIRSNGMSIALVINQLVSTILAAIFLPTVSRHGYSTMFFGFATVGVIYLSTVLLFVPETKGKSLEEIESYFSG